MKANKLLLFLLFFCSVASAQLHDLKGVVTEASTGIPIPGASIAVRGMSLGTISDIDGNFSLSGIPSGSVVVFSSLGFKDFEIKVTKSDNSLTVSMMEDSSAIEEIVVIGYGTQKKKDVTGSVSTVSAQTIQNIKPMMVGQALQGTVTGVAANISSGAPGSNTIIRIRGIATNGNASPTVIIDGYVSELELVNPADIETMTVLKDAQAAIYGTIGANGIIIITTKSGRKNSKGQISYNTYTGFQQTSRKLPVLNATEYALLLNEAYANGGQALPFPNVSGLGKGTDWQDEVFESASPIISHDLTFSGGSDKITYSVSGSHFDQEGIVGGPKSGFLRNTARIQLGADITSKLKLNTNAIYTYFNRKTLNENNLGSVLFNALNVPATLSPFDANGDHTLVPSTTGLGNEIINPLAQIANTYNDYNYKKLNGTFGLTYELIDGLSVTGRIGFNTSNSESRDFAMQVDYGNKVFTNPRSRVTQGAVNDNNYSFDLFAEYKKTLWEDHNLTATVGTTVFKEWGNGLFATGYDVPGNSWENADIDLTTGVFDGLTNSSYNYDERRLSHFGRLQYDYKGRYLISGMIRRDMSTKFGPENRVAYFPSATAGWVISEESFFKKDSKILNFLKLRASYGLLGNDQIPNNGYVSLLTGEATYVFDNVLTNGTAVGAITNPNLQWEEARKFDVGLDAGLFNDKISLTADYFVDVRENLLIPGLPVSGTLGGGAPGSGLPTVNAGAVKNYGAEFAVNYKDKLSENFSIEANYNVTFIKNKVTRVSNGVPFLEAGAFSVGQPAISRMEVGHPMGYFYGYVTDGIFQTPEEVAAHPSQVALGAEAQPGDIRFKDMNGDGVINTLDRREIGDPIPAATMGFNLNLKYKGFDFAAYSFAQLGHDMVRNYERTLSDANRLDYVLDRWTGPGTSNTVPRVTTGATSNNVFSDYFVEDASFARIQRVELGYSINPDFIGKAGFSKARFYVSVNNLYTFTKYKGYDPAASNGAPLGGGIDYGFYPLPRTFSLGANINF